MGQVGVGRPLDSLTPHCQLGLAGSYFPLCLRLGRAADKNIHHSRQADPRGVGFRFFLSFHSQKTAAQLTMPPKSGVTARGLRPRTGNFSGFKDSP